MRVPPRGAVETRGNPRAELTQARRKVPEVGHAESEATKELGPLRKLRTAGGIAHQQAIEPTVRSHRSDYPGQWIGIGDEQQKSSDVVDLSQTVDDLLGREVGHIDAHAESVLLAKTRFDHRCTGRPVFVRSDGECNAPVPGCQEKVGIYTPAMRLWRSDTGHAVRWVRRELVERRARTHEWQPARAGQLGQWLRDRAMELADNRHSTLRVEVLKCGHRAIGIAPCVAQPQLDELPIDTPCLVEVLHAKLQPGLQVTPCGHEPGARERCEGTDPDRLTAHQSSRHSS